MAHGQLGNLVNPGPLSSPHKTLDGLKNCTQCHSASQGLPDQKCLDCHTDIQERINARKGYHARVQGDCYTCHAEHKGRGFDMTGLSRLPFNHIDTGWPLTGSHRDLDCSNCHKAKRKGTNRPTYLGNDSRCIACHDNIHGSQKKKFQTCQSCHGTKTWEPRSQLKFNHNTDTRYDLTGSHKNVTCFDCHKTKKWTGLAFGTCKDCHTDPHKGSFGTDCQSCHNTGSWSSVKNGASSGSRGSKGNKGFNHNKTRFPLKGKHQKVTCKKCHGSKLGKMPNVKFSDCSGCHTSPHKAQFKKTWKTKTCKSCHSVLGFKNLNKFDHDKDSRYQLLGKHKKVACKSCHKAGKYRWLPGTPDCDLCHADPHKGKYEPQKCSSCHNDYNSFKRDDFDHNKTRFPLVASHKKVACNDCHKTGSYKGLSTACKSCHNDYHDGQLGNSCEHCHAPTKFNNIEFDHNRDSRFRIDGKHQQLACNQCHWGGTYKFDAFNCKTCHIDVHKGAHGHDCDRCHTTSGFEMEEGFHEFGEYTLKGVHDQLDCNTCHNPSEPVRTHNLQCSSCHVDPHMGSLGPSCYECHEQNSWLPTHFQHSDTGFELSGAHRFLDCDQCHQNRVFGGMPTECFFCHAKDFNSTLPQHMNAPTTCESCHFTFGFRPTK